MVGYYLEIHSKPPLRSFKTHEMNCRAIKHLERAFGSRTLTELSADLIEDQLRARLRERVRRKTTTG